MRMIKDTITYYKQQRDYNRLKYYWPESYRDFKKRLKLATKTAKELGKTNQN